MPKFYVMQQLPLGISAAAQPSFDNFVAGRNAEALAHVRELAHGTLPDDIVAYLLTRLPRDMASLQSIMEVLDRYSLMRKRALTLPLVREALAQEILAGQPPER